jgi:Aspartyl protease
MPRRIFAPVLSILLFAPCLSVRTMGQEAGKASLGLTVSFRLLAGFLVAVNGAVGDQEGLRFIIDTGTTTTMIHRRLADRLRLQRRAGKTVSFDRTVPVEWADAPGLRIGPIRSAPGPVMVANLAEHSTFGKGVDGIVGLDLLTRAQKLTIDYNQRTVTFLLDDGRLSERPSSRCLTVPVSLQGRPMHLVLDTGVEGIVLYRRRLGSLPAGPQARENSVPATMGRLHGTQMSLPGLRIGRREMAATVLLIDGYGADAPEGLDGVLGPMFLHASWIELDFARSTFRWK